MSIFAWVQPVDRVWKVVTDSEKGIIKIYNERDELISEQKNLEKDAVHLIEENFLKIVTTMLTGNDSGNDDTCQKADSCEQALVDNKYEYNSMYA
jgi:hypothetical protein